MRVSERPAPGEVTFDHRVNGLGVGSASPRLSWKPSPGPVTSYEIHSMADDGRAWAHRVPPEACLGHRWIGEPLASRERRVLRVRALFGDDPSSWSVESHVEAGLLERADWVADLIEPSVATTGRPIFRRLFRVDVPPVRARLYVTFHGIGVVQINGEVVSGDVLSPGWQSYNHRLAVGVYDVTKLVRAGSNTIEVRVGDGWWAGRLGFNELRGIYGDTLGVIAQLELSAEGSVRQTVASDQGWSWHEGPTVAADLYDGETYDGTLEPSESSDGWSPVAVKELPASSLLPTQSPAVRRQEVLAPSQIMSSPSGKTIIDFGQNLVGWLRLTVRDADPGTTIRIRHAEVLDRGEMGVLPLRTAAATDTWTLRGDGVETWEPSFTYHGFRYAEISGWPGQVEARDIEAIVVHSDLPRSGWFNTSHPGLQKLHDNVVWSTKGNFLSIPTDCPQRDERLGWTGDIAVFAPTATYLFDSTAFLTAWLEDVAAEQHEDGVIPYFVPSLPFPDELSDNPVYVHSPTAVWGDVSTLVPFALYNETGDIEVLRPAWPTMCRWVEAVHRLAGDSLVWDKGFQYGDWLDPAAPPEEPARGATDPSLVATAYFAHSARLASEAAGLLGYEKDAQRFANLHVGVVAAFRDRFVLGGGRLTSDSQTAYAIAIQLGLVDGEEKAAMGERLVDLVRHAGHTIATGFVGTPLILDALCGVGAIDDAYTLLLQTSHPSWLYAVDMGATTIWERWDSLLPDGSINPGGMTSFNHYALGSVASWLHSAVGGLSRSAPGWRQIVVAPRPHAAITQASTAHETPLGRAECSWQLIDGQIELDVLIPPGAEATLRLDGVPDEFLGPGRHRLKRRSRVSGIAAEPSSSMFDRAETSR